MAPTDEPAYRTRHRAAGDDITVRESEAVDDEDGVFEIRMPIASTGEVRNEGDDPLTRAELEGFATQIDERAIGVFPGHGTDTTIADGHYSPFERLGDWREGEFVARSEDGDDGVLMATARMPDPEELPAATGPYRRGLAILKEQAKRGIAQDASIGWRADESFPGGQDLMEASIVGIGADWRTNTDDEAAEVVAREAVAAGADPAELVERVERAVRDPDTDDARPFGPPGDPNRWDDHDECVAEVDDWDGIDDPDAYCAWAKSETGDRDGDADENSDTVTDDDTDTADSDPPDGGTTDDAQDADDGETSERAPDDLTEDRLATFAAAHYDGLDESDLMEAADAADAEFVGTTDVEELFDLVSVVTGAEYEAVADAMDGLMGESQEGDKPDDYDDDEDDEDEDGDMSADAPDDEQAADPAGEKALEAVEDLREEFREFKESGDTETPDRGGTDDADDTEADRAADTDTDGPNWRA